MSAIQSPTNISSFDEGRPVDLVHLSRQCLNDRAVEREVLGLFLRQSVIQLARLSQAASDTDRQAAAHTIVGAARAIGAWPVAHFAQAVEEAGAEEIPPRLAALTGAINQATAFIRRVLSDQER